MLRNLLRFGTRIVVLSLGVQGPLAQGSAEDQIRNLLQEDRPHHWIPGEIFDKLGWDLPDGGSQVKSLADEASGGAFDPRKLESLPADQLGYHPSWHEVRFNVYGLDWEIGGLHLVPNQPLTGFPTLVIIHGGSANWYEFFLDPFNRPGLGQYLAQKIPVLLLTIPGNYKHGGWTERSYGDRIPGYLLHQEISAGEAKIRNAVFTFRVVMEGVEQIIEKATKGPVVVVGHSTGGEIPFLLMNTRLKSRMNGLFLGWGSGGPARLDKIIQGEEAHRKAVFERFDKYAPVQDLRVRSAEEYAFRTVYIGPLNPCKGASKLDVARCWFHQEERRRPQFKQKLQDLEHNGADELLEQTEKEIREALLGNKLGVKPEEVIADLFSTNHSPLTGYRKMLWLVGKLDGHARMIDGIPSEARMANEFRKQNPNVPIRVAIFDVPITHYAHIERPRELAAGMLAGLRWLMDP